MKVIKIKKEWFSQSDLRIDASFHLSEGRVTKLKIGKCPYSIKYLVDITENIFNGARFKRYYVADPNKGVPFIGSSDMVKSELGELKYISKRLSKNISKLLLKKSWTLVSCSGTIGNTVYTNEDFVNVAASQHIMRIVPTKDIYSGFLYSFLSSKYGYSLLTQGTYGAVIQHIEPQHLLNLPVPIFPELKQKLIHDLIENASLLKAEANRILKEAVQFFETKIGISDTTLGFQYNKIKSSNLAEFHKRLDSQYNILWKSLKNDQLDTLNYEKIKTTSKSIFVGGRGKRMYVKNGIPFLSSSEMMLYNPKRKCKMVSKNTPGLNEMLVNKYDILISRSGTVGNTIIVGDDLSGIAISEHALRLVIDMDKISPNYVFCFLKTKWGMRSMEASSFGSVIITLNEDLIGNIDIPILSDQDQKHINEKIENYIRKMDKSTLKENQAIDLIEKEIESWQE
ncbi:MAG TPA: restriction endonuclease subunit S [Saprospiraceae bacterium]|nr:restriction endonuclease subunit S [Saprospiraceae bacterium]